MIDKRERSVSAESNRPTLIGTCANPDGSVTYHYEFPEAIDLDFGMGGPTIEGFVITGYPADTDRD